MAEFSVFSRQSSVVSSPVSCSEWGRENENEMSNGFRDLLVWQKSMHLAVEIYKLTKDFPREEIYGLTNQIRKSAISVPSNIAEGYGRLNAGEFRQFLGIARGSTYELQTKLELAQSLGLASSDQIETASRLSQEIGKMIHALLGSIQILTLGSRN